MSQNKERVTIVDNITYASVVGNERYGVLYPNTIFFTDNKDGHGDILVGNKLYTNTYNVDERTIINNMNLSFNLVRNDDTHELEFRNIDTESTRIVFDVANEDEQKTITFNYNNGALPVASSIKINNIIVAKYLTVDFVPEQNNTYVIRLNDNIDDTHIDNDIYKDINTNISFRFYVDDTYYTLTIHLTVKNSDITPTSVMITPNEMTLVNGETTHVTFITTPYPISDKYHVEFGSSDTSVATVDNFGVVNAVHEGTCEISCSLCVDSTMMCMSSNHMTLKVNKAKDAKQHVTLSPKQITVDTGKTGTAYFYRLLYPDNIIKNNSMTWNVPNELSGLVHYSSNKDMMYFSYSGLTSSQKVLDINYSFTDIFDNTVKSNTSQFVVGSNVNNITNIVLDSFNGESNTSITNMCYDATNKRMTGIFKLTCDTNASSVGTLLDISSRYFIIEQQHNSKSGTTITVTVTFKMKEDVNTKCTDYITVSPKNSETLQTIDLIVNIDKTMIQPQTITAFYSNLDNDTTDIADNDDIKLYIEYNNDNVNNWENLTITQSPSNIFNNILYGQITNNASTHTLTIPVTLSHNATQKQVQFTATLTNGTNESSKRLIINVKNSETEPEAIDLYIDNQNTIYNVYNYLYYDYYYGLIPDNAIEREVVFDESPDYEFNYENNTVIFKIINDNYTLNYEFVGGVRNEITNIRINKLQPILNLQYYYTNDQTPIDVTNIAQFEGLTQEQIDDVKSRMIWGTDNANIFRYNSATNTFSQGDQIESVMNKTTNVIYCKIKDYEGHIINESKTYLPVYVASREVLVTSITGMSWENDDNILSVGKENILNVQYTPATANVEPIIDFIEFENDGIMFEQIGAMENGVIRYKVWQRNDVGNVQQSTLTLNMNNVTQPITSTYVVCPIINQDDLSFTTNITDFYVKYADMQYDDLVVTLQSTKTMWTIEFTNNELPHLNYVQEGNAYTISSDDFTNMSTDEANQTVNNTLKLNVKINNFITKEFTIDVKAHLYSMSPKQATYYMLLDEVKRINECVTFVPEFASVRDVTITQAPTCIGCSFVISGASMQFKRTSVDESIYGGSFSAITCASNENPEMTTSFNVVLLNKLNRFNIPTQYPLMNVYTKLSYSMMCNVENATPIFNNYDVLPSSNAKTIDTLKLSYVIKTESSSTLSMQAKYSYFTGTEITSEYTINYDVIGQSISFNNASHYIRANKPTIKFGITGTQNINLSKSPGYYNDEYVIIKNGVEYPATVSGNMLNASITPNEDLFNNEDNSFDIKLRMYVNQDDDSEKVLYDESNIFTPYDITNIDSLVEKNQQNKLTNNIVFKMNKYDDYLNDKMRITFGNIVDSNYTPTYKAAFFNMMNIDKDNDNVVFMNYIDNFEQNQQTLFTKQYHNTNNIAMTLTTTQDYAEEFVTRYSPIVRFIIGVYNENYALSDDSFVTSSDGSSDNQDIYNTFKLYIPKNVDLTHTALVINYETEKLVIALDKIIATLNIDMLNNSFFDNTGNPLYNVISTVNNILNDMNDEVHDGFIIENTDNYVIGFKIVNDTYALFDDENVTTINGIYLYKYTENAGLVTLDTDADVNACVICEMKNTNLYEI